mmetsp:Transcript_3246/g.12992  ORF Transcript_3246/g.12992 Transcript_3246/m.12992 type:complete len:204 (-) Transcript_3246:280-891(-)
MTTTLQVVRVVHEVDVDRMLRFSGIRRNQLRRPSGVAHLLLAHPVRIASVCDVVHLLRAVLEVRPLHVGLAGPDVRRDGRSVGARHRLRRSLLSPALALALSPVLRPDGHMCLLVQGVVPLVGAARDLARASVQLGLVVVCVGDALGRILSVLVEHQLRHHRAAGNGSFLRARLSTLFRAEGLLGHFASGGHPTFRVDLHGAF